MEVMAEVDMTEDRMIKIIPITCHSVINLYYRYYSITGINEPMLKFCLALKKFLLYHKQKVTPINRSIVHSTLLWMGKDASAVDEEYCQFASKDLADILKKNEAANLVFPLSTMQYMSQDLITNELETALLNQHSKIDSVAASFDSSKPRSMKDLASVVSYLRVCLMAKIDSKLPADFVDRVVGKLMASVAGTGLNANNQIYTSLQIALVTAKAIDSQ